MHEMIYLYDGSFYGFLCCVFDSYANKEVLTAIYRDEDFTSSLFAARTIRTDPAHAKRVFRKIVQISPYAGDLVHRGFLSCLPDKELHLYHLIVKLLRDGSRFLQDFSDPMLYPVVTAVRHLNSEVHLLKGFVRFSELGGVLGSEIEPKNRVLPLLRSHFSARYLNEAFFIYDRTHREVLLYSGGKSRIQPLDGFEMAPPDETEAKYRLLWKRFYDTIAIKERLNPICQRTHMPLRYRSTMTEFQDASYFKPQNSCVAVPNRDAPAGTPAPGTRPKPGLSAPESTP